MSEYIVFGAPQLAEDEIDEVVKTLRSGWIGTGVKVQTFETQIAEYKHSQHAVAVNSCTAALHLSLCALGISPGDEVITTTMTFCATVNAILHAGGTPVLVDCDRDRSTIDPAQIEAAITKKTKAIIPVHFAGLACPMDDIVALANKHNLAIIEDCAHAVETRYKGQPVGTFGAFGVLSFYVTKNICTGEGGMILTHSKDHAKALKEMALHGLSKDAWSRFSKGKYQHYQAERLGYKYNMTDISASLGIKQFEKIEAYHEKRQRIFRQYNEAFKSLPVTRPLDADDGDTHAYHLYPLLLNLASVTMTRDELIAQLNDAGIGTGVHYRAVHLHPFYQTILGENKGRFPNADYISERTISLPLSPYLTEKQVSYIIETVTDILNKSKQSKMGQVLNKSKQSKMGQV